MTVRVAGLVDEKQHQRAISFPSGSGHQISVYRIWTHAEQRRWELCMHAHHPGARSLSAADSLAHVSRHGGNAVENLRRGALIVGPRAIHGVPCLQQLESLSFLREIMTVTTAVMAFILANHIPDAVYHRCQGTIVGS